MPPLIGWTAVTGTIGLPAMILFAVIFLWTPPHTWALGFKYLDDYRRAGVPMLPVVADPIVVTRRIVAYTWACVVVALSLLAVAQVGAVYAIAVSIFGTAFIGEAHRLNRAASRARPLRPMRVFHTSNVFLLVVFAAAAVDALVHH